MRIYTNIFCSILFLSASSSALAGLDTGIKVSLEDPAADSVRSGIGNTRGFATTPYADYEFPIVRIELYLDGGWIANIPYGGVRTDVCVVFDYPNCENSGFGSTYNFSELSAGSHTMKVRAVDSLGDYNESSKNFTVERFDNPFILNSGDVDFLETEVSLPRNSNGNPLDKRIYLDNVYADGECYNVDLDWSRSIQGWSIIDIHLIDPRFCDI